MANTRPTLAPAALRRMPEDLPLVVRPRKDLLALVAAAVLVTVSVLIVPGAIFLPLLKIQDGKAGVWVRRNSECGLAAFVPWAAIQRIRPRRFGLIRMVVFDVHPAFRWPPDGPLGAFAGLFQVISGTGAAISVTYSDADADGLLAELRRLSAGRVWIG